ncbi:MAG TPA: redox-sensing transcriptional repressor Rex [Bacillota bacterium]|nr:redox-sensing transcriptional repressor Rex [Bacillota bacterium]HPT88254.1 redox-sensing transcriptional repressor Rex [Bacillota bacterium]
MRKMGHESGNINQRRHQQIPLAVIKRLPIYHRYLSDLHQKEVARISSSELAAKIGITASQLRQDLSWFGSFGQQGYGYRVDELLQEVSRILGLNQNIGMVLIGAGRLGRAIIHYANFKRRGFHTKAIFDNNPDIVGEIIDEIPVYNISELENYLKSHAIQIGVITTPASAAQEVADRLVRCGIKGIWNFAPVSLKVPDDVIVEHVHIGESLMVLSMKLQQRKEQASDD